METNHFDVLIVGAGLSGIGAAYHLQTRCPGKTFALLEARQSTGGTWDLFRYPGIRSDSDMYTLGYSFKPWTGPKAIADGASILSYIRDAAREHGIDSKIRCGHRVESASWSSAEARWTLRVRQVESDTVVTFTCNFLFVCAGYYDYDAGYTPEFPGRERFKGEIVHPQKWTSDVAYTGKRVVVIGSGATAMTLVPALARSAAHVTMLQRSPTYVVSLPERDPIASWFRARLPQHAAYVSTRWKNVLMSMAFFEYCRRRPAVAKKLILAQIQRQLRGKVPLRPHFDPRYNPWDQRLCLVPDGDLFAALRDGRASVVTDHIDTFTETGIRLKSGEELPADLIVTATGLRLKFLGGVSVTVDGRQIAPKETMAYRGMMFSDVPNMAVALGYTNASWTLKCDLTCEFVCRLLQHMDASGTTMCVPRRDPTMESQPILDFSSGYVLRARDEFPTQGTASPWRLYQNYALDLLALRHSRIDDGVLEFTRPNRAPARPMHEARA